MNKPTLQIKTVIERQAAAPDTQIDEAAYRLYRLTEEEIKTAEVRGRKRRWGRGLRRRREIYAGIP